jgi:hypothetical protein
MNYYLMNASLSFKSYRVRKIGILILLVPRQNTSKDLSQQEKKRERESMVIRGNLLQEIMY